MSERPFPWGLVWMMALCAVMFTFYVVGSITGSREGYRRGYDEGVEYGLEKAMEIQANEFAKYRKNSRPIQGPPIRLVPVEDGK